MLHSVSEGISDNRNVIAIFELQGSSDTVGYGYQQQNEITCQKLYHTRNFTGWQVCVEFKRSPKVFLMRRDKELWDRGGGGKFEERASLFQLFRREACSNSQIDTVCFFYRPEMISNLKPGRNDLGHCGKIKHPKASGRRMNDRCKQFRCYFKLLDNQASQSTGWFGFNLGQ